MRSDQKRIHAALEELSEKDLRLLACFWAEHALSVWGRNHKGDDRPKNIIEASRKYVAGRLSYEELSILREKMPLSEISPGDEFSAFYAAKSCAHISALEAAKRSSDGVSCTGNTVEIRQQHFNDIKSVLFGDHPWENAN